MPEAADESAIEIEAMRRSGGSEEEDAVQGNRSYGLPGIGNRGIVQDPSDPLHLGAEPVGLLGVIIRDKPLGWSLVPPPGVRSIIVPCA